MAVDPAASFGQSAKILHSEGCSLIFLCSCFSNRSEEVWESGSRPRLASLNDGSP
jgi:hypothetical protein